MAHCDTCTCLYETTSVAATVSYDTAWTNWITTDNEWTIGTCTASSSTQDVIWTGWITASDNGTIVYDGSWKIWIDEAQVAGWSTPEQLEEIERNRAEQERLHAERLAKADEERKKRAAEQLEAQKKANLLLLMLLTAMQRQDYEKTKGFTVISKDGKRKYRVENNGSAVYLLNDKDQKVKHYCIYAQHPKDWQLPQEDQATAKLLLLRNDENRFLKVANASQLSVPAA